MDLGILNLVVAGLAGILTGLVGLGAFYLSKRQNWLTTAAVASDWLRDLRDWASEGIDLISEAACARPGTNTDSRLDEQRTVSSCRRRLSALIDRGRLLLPNERQTEYGQHKPPAYQGYRHPALDALVAAERLLSESPELLAFPDRSAALVGIQREFVSIVQAILDPLSTNKMIASILMTTHESRAKDLTVGGLLPHPEKLPPGADRLLHIASARYQAEMLVPKTGPSPRLTTRANDPAPAI